MASATKTGFPETALPVAEKPRTSGCNPSRPMPVSTFKCTRRSRSVVTATRL